MEINVGRWCLIKRLQYVLLLLRHCPALQPWMDHTIHVSLRELGTITSGSLMLSVITLLTLLSLCSSCLMALVFAFPTAFRSPCSRVFKYDDAQSMHLRDSKVNSSPAATMSEPTWKCMRCDTDFNSRDKLRTHTHSPQQHFPCIEYLEDGKWQDVLTKS